MKKILLGIVLSFTLLFGQTDLTRNAGAIQLYNYWLDFVADTTLGTSSLTRTAGQIEFQNEMIDFLLWADSTSATVIADTVNITDGTDTYYFTVITDTLGLYNDNDVRIAYFDSLGTVYFKNDAEFNGKIGIGTDSPEVSLHIESDGDGAQLTLTGKTDATADAILLLSATGATNAQGLKLWYDRSTAYGYIDNLYNNDAGNIYFRTKTAGTPINAMTILGTGVVSLSTGAGISEFSTDGAMTGDSDVAVPTEKAVKKYVDDNVSSSLWTDDASQTYLTQDSEPMEFRKTGLAHGMTSISNTDAYANFKISDAADGGLKIMGMSKTADVEGLFLGAGMVEATPTDYPMKFTVGKKSVATWSPFASDKKAFGWYNNTQLRMTLNSSAKMTLSDNGATAANNYHQLGLYHSSPSFCLTDISVNTNITSMATAQDSNAIWLDADDITPEIGISGGDGDAWNISINADDGALFENATTYNFDNNVNITGTLGDAKWIDHRHITVENLKIPVANNPSVELVGLTSTLRFDDTADESVYAIICLDSAYDDGEDITLHFHWSPTIDANAGNVTWGIEWHASLRENNELINTAGTTQIVNDATQSLQYEHLNTSNITISGTGLVSGTSISVRFFRDADASEATATDDYAVDVDLIKICVNVPNDKLR